LDQVPVLEQLLLNAVELLLRNAHRREDRLTLVLGDPEQDVAAALVVEVVREGTDGPHHGRGVPSFLELQPVRLDLADVEEIREPEGQGVQFQG
jgi:hypothetical protein